MNQFFKDPLTTCLFFLNHWGSIVVIFGIVSGVGKYILKILRSELYAMHMNVKRIELTQAIDHDYPLEVVCQIYDDYVALGGNSYAKTLFEEYKEKKENEQNKLDRKN